MKLTYSTKHQFVTYDVVAKVAFTQDFIERRKVITNEVNEETTTPTAYDDTIEQSLITKEIERLTTVIWNCKNTLRFSQDQSNIVLKEQKRMEESAEKIEFLTKLIHE